MSARPAFVTRKFPPSTGGMETLAAGVWRGLRADHPDAVLIAHGGANHHLVWWLPVAVARVIGLVVRRRVDVVLCGDAVVNAVLWPVLRLGRVRWATMVMGLDVTYANPLYRATVVALLRRTPSVVAISRATAEAAIDAGVDADRVHVVPLGVEVPESSDRAAAAGELRRRLDLGDGDVVLVTLGRLVRRKGVAWFVAEVLPHLPAHVHLVVAGSGEDAGSIDEAVARSATTDRVHRLGAVTDEDREILMAGADVFVQPNIAVPGDMEGFGLVTVEAAVRGTPVLAADLEGIRDAVVHGVTGLLVASGDPDAWIEALGPLVDGSTDRRQLGERLRAGAIERYSEEAMGRALRALL